ncbi:MAG TPA: PVC-type heme-binding CxxCH protein [Saprospiraceae bacterium]|nr:PVC-type heme-binding CxxCH protein [Saprospiraceae bacterium]
MKNRIPQAILWLVLLTGCQITDSSRAPDGFEIHPAFRMDLVAAEPLVFDPVDMAFDEKGDAYVLEMPGYPFSRDASRIVLLKDQDGDGVFEERKVYARGLGVASSLLPYKGGFLVAAPPELVWLKDTDGDQIADHQEVIMEGFEVGNLQHNYNGLSYGLDNWIYAANGGNNGHPYFVGRPNQPLDLRGEDFRIRIEQQQIERVGTSSGGFELAFDQWGHMYETHNLEHVSQLVFPERYIEGLAFEPDHTLSLISDHEENGLSRIYPIGEQETRVNHPEQSGYFSGSCGITFYGGNAFPAGFNNNLFVADVVLNLIHLDVLSPNKAVYKASRMREKVEFLASTDRAFRPVNMTTGPDGALYLLDMHRAVIEHPEWIPDEIEESLDLEAGTNQGRIYRITPRKGWRPDRPNLDKAVPATLVEALSSPNQWTRLTAQRLIVASGDSVYQDLLVNKIKDPSDPLTILHALWSLEGLGHSRVTLLMQAIKSEESGLQANAIKIAERYLPGQEALINEIIKLIDEASPEVAMQAALSLGTLGAAQYKPYESAIATAFSELLARPDIDIWTAMAVASATRYQAGSFTQRLLSSDWNEYQETVALALARMVGQERQPLEIRNILASLIEQDRLEETKKAALVEALSEGWGEKALVSSTSKGISLLIRELESSEGASIVRACAHLRKAMQLPVSVIVKEKITAALKEVKNQDRSAAQRLELLKLIELEAFDLRAATLYSLLDHREPLAIQEESLWQLWRSNEPSVGPKLVEMWPNLGPDARKKAGDILLYKTFNQEVLLSALEQGKINMGEMNFDLERRRTLLRWTDNAAVRRRAEKLFSDAGVVTRQEAIEKMRPALDLAGDILSGKEHFINLCSQCHRYGTLGEEVGPVLTEINRKSKESLLYDILDPNAAVDTKYINHQVKTRDGNIYTGIISKESDHEIVLIMMGGQEQKLAKKDIEQLSSLGISMMPEGQEANLSPQEMANLLAFLQQDNF